jgi:hypothetical protein
VPVNPSDETTALERLLRPLPPQMSAELACALVNLRADEPMQARYDELAALRTEGRLTAAEQEELEDMVRANTLVGLLRAAAISAPHPGKTA